MNKIKRTLTCIVCPRGCTLDITLNNGIPSEISGNICPRGVTYATDECIAPKRTLTSTVRCNDGCLVAVKTDKPIPKELIFEVMKEINIIRVENNIKIGDVVIENVSKTGSNIVVTSEKYI